MSVERLTRSQMLERCFQRMARCRHCNRELDGLLVEVSPSVENHGFDVTLYGQCHGSKETRKFHLGAGLISGSKESLAEVMVDKGAYWFSRSDRVL